jgi:hypothetical protein
MWSKVNGVMSMTTQELLDQAQAAYHSLNIGTMASVVVDRNGERVEFNRTNRADLYAYIQQLQGMLPCAPGSPYLGGPATFTF